MVLLFLAEMKISSSVANRLALGNHLNAKAEYIAKSGANLAVFLLTADLAIELTAFELSPDAKFPPIWNMLNGLPIGGETLELMTSMQESFDLSKVNDSKVLDQLKQFDGSFVLNIEDESSKININYCGVGNGIKCMTMLEALFACPAEREFLERKKVVSGELITAIRDYIDVDDRPDPKAIYSSEEDPYGDDANDVFPKNARFDSVDELRNILGWDHEIHKIFSPYLTVYPIPKTTVKQSTLFVNFNSAGRELLGCLLPKANQECAEKSAIYANNQEEIDPPTTFAGVKSVLQEQYCTSSEDLAKQFTTRSDTFRITVTGQVEDQQRVVNAVIHREMPDDFDKKAEKSAVFKYLHWKML